MYVLRVSKIVYFTGSARSDGIHRCKWEDDGRSESKERS